MVYILYSGEALYAHTSRTGMTNSSTTAIYRPYKHMQQCLSSSDVSVSGEANLLSRETQ